MSPFFKNLQCIEFNKPKQLIKLIWKSQKFEASLDYLVRRHLNI
jgi:hypothetical protein